MLTQSDIDRFRDMNSHTLIGISGFAGSGKSAASRVLAKHGYSRMKLAGALKDMTRAYLVSQGVDISEIEEMIEGSMKELPHPKLNGTSPRHVMQHLGQSFREKFGDDFWTNAWRRSVEASGARLVCCDDVRYENEAALIREMGGIIIRIHRPGVGPVNDHASERGIDADATILNDGTIQGLERIILRHAGIRQVAA